MSSYPHLEEATLENVFKSWHANLIEEMYIHSDIQCDECLQPVRGVRNRCRTCEDYDLCSSCVNRHWEVHDPDHGFYWIQYRRLPIPPINGDDYELIRRFHDGRTSESFYLHYPWFFTSVIFALLINGTIDQAQHQMNADQILCADDPDSANVALDQYVRLLSPEEWNWESVQEEVGVIIGLQLRRAQFSQQFYDLYKSLPNGTVKSSVGDKGDAVMDKIQAKKQIYDGHLSKDQASRAIELFSDYCAQRETEWRRGESGVAIGTQSAQIKYLQFISLDPRSRGTAFPVLEEVENLLRSNKQRRGYGDRWSIHDYETKREEVHRLYGLCAKEQLRLANLSGTYIDSPRSGAFVDNAPMDEKTRSRLHLQCGHFNDAIEALQPLKGSDPAVAFELLRIFEKQGHLKRAVCVPFESLNSLRDPVGTALFELARACLGCFTKGAWAQALEKAMDCSVCFLDKPLPSISPVVLAQMEIYFHRILSWTRRDLGGKLDHETVGLISIRLKRIRGQLQQLQRDDLALEFLQLELELQQDSITVYELGESDYLTDSTDYIMNADVAHTLCQEFIRVISERELEESKATGAQITCGYARLILAEALASASNPTTATADLDVILREAERIFSSCDCSLGLAEAQLIRIRYNLGVKEYKAELERVKDTFERLGFLTGLHRAAECEAALDTDRIDGRIVGTAPRAQEKLLPLLKQSGNELQYCLRYLHSMRSWIQGPAFIVVCEQIFHPEDGFQSDEVCLTASRLLSQLYTTNNNLPEATAHGLLYMKYAQSRNDPGLLHSAILNYLRTVANLTATFSCASRVEELTNLGVIWDKWVYSMLKGAVKDTRIDQDIRFSELPITTLLWLADTVGCIVQEDSLQPLSPQLLRIIVANLRLSSYSLSLLPPSLRWLFANKVETAMGTAVEYCGNPILALLCYDEARIKASEHDGFAAQNLGLQIGRRLDSLIHWNRGSFIDFQDLARAYLTTAEDFFWAEMEHQSSYKNALEASMILARSYLRQVQLLVETLDWGEDSEADTLSKVQDENKKLLVEMCNKGLSSIKRGISGNLQMRKQLIGELPPMQALENSRYFYFGQMEELYWTHMGLEMDLSTLNRDPFPLWEGIQQWKAICLVDIISEGLSQAIDVQQVIEPIKTKSPGGVKNPNKVQDLLEDSALGHGATVDDVWTMAEDAERDLAPGESIIFIDWTRYHNTFFITAFNGTSGALRKAVVEFDYSAVEQWVARNLGIQSQRDGRIARKRLLDASRLAELKPLLERLDGFIKDEDLLVLCPTGILHSVPLHAIPFGLEGNPLIASNPVIYCASNALLSSCVSKARSKFHEDTFRAVAFARLGPDDPTEEERMQSVAESAMQHFHQTITACGRNLTRKAFSHQSRDASILHYHGHAHLEVSERKNRALVLESTPSDTGLFTVMDIFELQLKAAVVVLLACASGEEDVSPNDDPLGLLSAFMYAGASSVVATLWPTQTSDARNFSEKFYRYAFGQRQQGAAVYLAKAVQRAVRDMWEEWDEDEPYHWAQFELHGAWFCRVPEEGC